MTESARNPASPNCSHEQFIRLFLQAERELLRYVMVLVPNAADARDILQETAVALWAKVDQYDPSKPFVAWACRFALNEARTFLRAQARRERFLAEDVVELLRVQRLDAAEHLDARRTHLDDCLGRLPSHRAELIRAHYFDEQSAAELSRRFGRSVEAIYKSLQRVRQTLHECIQLKLAQEAEA